MIDNGTKGFGGTVTVTVTREEDKAKYDSLTDEEKAMLADMTSTATMSLQDSHGDILAAIRDSLNNQVAIELTVE